MPGGAEGVMPGGAMPGGGGTTARRSCPGAMSIGQGMRSPVLFCSVPMWFASSVLCSFGTLAHNLFSLSLCLSGCVHVRVRLSTLLLID